MYVLFTGKINYDNGTLIKITSIPLEESNKYNGILNLVCNDTNIIDLIDGKKFEVRLPEDTVNKVIIRQSPEKYMVVTEVNKVIKVDAGGSIPDIEEISKEFIDKINTYYENALKALYEYSKVHKNDFLVVDAPSFFKDNR